MKKITLLFALLTFLYGNAQWTTDTAVNTLVASTITDDTQSVGTTDGKTFIVFWKVVPSPINYELRVQLLDTNGNQLFGPEGMLISNSIPMSTSTMNWKLTIDKTNNLYVGVTGSDADAGYPGYVYKINTTGTLLWGTNGVCLGTGIVPTILPLDNGDVIISYWTGSGQSKIQKYTATGTPIWTTPTNIMPTNGTSATIPADIYELSNQEFIVVFHTKSGAGIASLLYAQKYNSSGIAQWATPTQLTNKSTAYNRTYSGAQDGDVVYYGYSGATGTRYDSYLQRINPDGTLPWGINGSDFDTNQTSYEINTKIAFKPGSQYVWSIAAYTPSTQDLKGEYVQKFDKITGARQFTDNARQVFPMDTNYRNHAGNLQLINGNPFFLIMEGFNDGFTPIHLKTVLLDANGDFAWPEHFLPVATFAANKTRIHLNTPVNNESVVVFIEPKVSEEFRIYAQKFTTPTLTVNDFGVTENSFQLYPNPANEIVTVKGTSPINSVAVYNSLGQLVYSNTSVNSFDLTVNIQPWANGLYMIDLETTNGIKEKRKLIKN